MKKNISKTVWILFVSLVIFACLPVSRFLNPATIPLETEIPEKATVSVAPSVTPTMKVDEFPLPTGTMAALLPLTISPDLNAFIQAPEGPLANPYVILLGFQTVTEAPIEISGILNSSQFVCAGSPCTVPVESSSLIVFRAISPYGSSSEDISAIVRVELGEDGYYVYIDSVSQFTLFSDSCLRNWRIEDSENPEWAQFFQFPYELNTDKTLHHLVTKLIIQGIVDVDGCPAGGLSAGLSWPTGCGLERARPKMIEWQNQYDEYIWLASRDIGIPPKILKTLIEIESQFWPGDQRYYLDEIGLGQINQLGVDVLLRRDPQLYQTICSEVLNDCTKPYALLEEEEQALLRGVLASSQSAVCPECEHGIEMAEAKNSINLIARVIKANCETVKIVVDEYQDDALVDAWEDPYTDFWKFTLFSYHNGISCFENTVEEIANNDELINWENFLKYINCKDGDSYVDGVWGNLLNFDFYRYTVTGRDQVQYVSVFAPTPTPFPTPVLSTAQVDVQIFLDSNQNGVAEDSEWLNGAAVNLRADNGMELSGITVNGKVLFDLTGFPINGIAVVSIPGLYRSETFTIPAQGVVPLTFIFDLPVLPTAIP